MKLDLEEFVREYWQRRPLLIRGALEPFVDPITPEELAGLAMEEGIEARMIVGPPGDTAHSVRHGPFVERDFTGLPDVDWTLLVQRVDQAIPAVADLLDSFRFVPNWRLDDVMISYAVPGGGVGAHVDQYDVFLVQGAGRRRWSIARTPVERSVGGGEGGLDLLPDFTPDDEWVLEPGDVLYLPPRIAHSGVAVDPAMTYSVGFRAPAHGELLAAFVAERLDAVDPSTRLVDPAASPSAAPGEITPAVVRQLSAVLAGELDAGRLGEWFGRYVTRPSVEPVGEEPGPGPWRALRRSSPAHFAYLEQGEQTLLFVGGESYRCESAWSWLASWLADAQSLTGDGLARAQAVPECGRVLRELLRKGYLYLAEDA